MPEHNCTALKNPLIKVAINYFESNIVLYTAVGCKYG